MNILILGSGGREHALGWKISQSEHCDNLYIAPGNAGTASIGKNIDLNILDFSSLSTFVDDNNVSLVVVGPEQPLVKGITDYLETHHTDLIVIGPSQKGAELEGSKAFAKEFMKEYEIPTASYAEFTPNSVDKGIVHIRNSPGPYVLKADGLAGGKGVLIVNDAEEAISELTAMLSGKFGAASHKVIIEGFLDGIEFSVFVLTDGKKYTILPQAKDYKRIGEGDHGLNTGGMGAISPVSFVDEEMMEKVRINIIEPTIKGLSHRNMRYRGFVFIGLISVNNEPKVIEYNCRLGDPETQVVIPRIENDLIDLFLAVNNGTIGTQKIKTLNKSSATIVCASGGYPELYKTGYPISGLEDVRESIVFHAGTSIDNNTTITSGGRVISVTSFGDSKDVAVERSLDSISKISFRDMYYRKDIGFDLR